MASILPQPQCVKLDIFLTSALEMDEHVLDSRESSGMFHNPIDHSVQKRQYFQGPRSLHYSFQPIMHVWETYLIMEPFTLTICLSYFSGKGNISYFDVKCDGIYHHKFCPSHDSTAAMPKFGVI